MEGMELLTSLELETVNGTDVQLKCTFKSTHPLSEDNVSVSWSFRPLRKMTEEWVRLNGCGVNVSENLYLLLGKIRLSTENALFKGC